MLEDYISGIEYLSGQGGTELQAIRQAEARMLSRALGQEAVLRAAGNRAALARAAVESEMAVAASTAANVGGAAVREVAAATAQTEAEVARIGGATLETFEAQKAQTSYSLARALAGREGRVTQLITAAAALGTMYIVVQGFTYYVDSGRARQLRDILDDPSLTPEQREKIIESYVRSLTKPPSFLQELTNIVLLLAGVGAAGMVLYWFLFMKPESKKS